MRKYTTEEKINKVEITDETLTGRGGLSLFVRYLSNIEIYGLLEEKFGQLRKSRKGLPVWNLFKQIMCFFFDGTSRHLTYFDHLKEDEGYAAVIENKLTEMVSSHAIKRFFKSFSWLAGGIFRKILKALFIWRLNLEKPEEILLTLDTMVMDNDEAEQREGVEPTYKKKKGFQPLQLIWNRRIVDAVFRGGSKHSNHGNTAVNMLSDAVKKIRREYRDDITIIIRTDSGFLDGNLLNTLDRLNVGFICTGKMYSSVKEYMESTDNQQYKEYDNGNQEWEYLEFGYRCGTWKKFYKAIYTTPKYEDNQMLMEFARPDNLILTNIGVNPEVLENSNKRRQKKLKKSATIIELHHGRGRDELPHRGLKEFGFEQMPFKRFSPNQAFYYCMLVSFFLFETYKEDVLSEVVPIASYADTVRRKAVDFAVKLVKTGHKVILKITEAIRKRLDFMKLWERSRSPIPIN